MADLIPTPILAELGKRIRSTIRRRTARGISATGSPFAPKEDGNRSNLIDSGTLLDTIEVRVERGRVVVEATAPYAEHVHAKRPFLGLTDAEQVEMSAWLEDAVERHLRGELREFVA